MEDIKSETKLMSSINSKLTSEINKNQQEIQKFKDKFNNKVVQLQNDLYEQNVAMRKVKDITIVSFEKEIERINKLIEEPSSKSLEYDSAIPFRRMHQKQLQERQKSIKDNNPFFISQKEFSETNKPNKLSVPNLNKNTDSSRNTLKSIENIEAADIIKKGVPIHTSTSNQQYIRYKSLQNNAPNSKKVKRETENNPNNMNNIKALGLTESRPISKHIRNQSKDSIK